MTRITFEHDFVGLWTEIKIHIIREYAAAYSSIISRQRNPKFHHSYIDAFAGSGIHISKNTGKVIKGSPSVALEIIPPFRRYYFLDKNEAKIEQLQILTSQTDNVTILHGDSNNLILQEVFPNIRYDEYQRGLCFLDPYNLDVHWEVVRTAGEMKSIDLFIHFSVHAMNRSVLSKSGPNEDSKKAIKALDLFWGDDTWREIAYKDQQQTFFQTEKTKVTNYDLALAYQARLKDVAGFKFVPDPIALKNSSGSTIFYLFFASHKAVAGDIVKSIFKKYRSKGY